MNYIQEAVDFASSNSYTPIIQRLRLPSAKNNVSIFLLSDSYEYDIELIKSFPSPKMNYKTIVVPYRMIDKIGIKPFRYILSQNDYNKKLLYISNQKSLNPKLTALRYPYPSTLEQNTYVSMSDVFHKITPIIRQMSLPYIRENIFDVFNRIMRHFSFSKQKVLWIDTERYTIYNSQTTELFKTDLINALIAAYLLNPNEKIKHLDWIIVFREKNADYKFDLSRFTKQDLQRLRFMLSKIGKPLATENQLSADASLDDIEDDTFDIDKALDTTDVSIDDEEKELDDDELKNIQSSQKSSVDEIRSSISSISAKYGQVESDDEDNKKQQSLYDAKAFNINATLLKRIQPDTTIVQNYKHLAKELESPSDKNNPVEKSLIDDAAKKLSDVVTPANEDDALHTTTSAREIQIRKQVGQVRLNNITFEKLSSVTDVPLPPKMTPLRLTTTSRGALKGTSFSNIAQEYEDKLMDRDIVSTFMNLSKLPNGFYVTNVEVTDISTVTSLMNNWKITLKNKQNDLQSIINIRIPKVINGRFYNNGVWYNIQKQDFPIPVMKIDQKTAVLKSNYNTITATRYDTKSLVDLSMMVKIVNKLTDASGNNPYIKPGISTKVNAKYVSTIEYDEYAKRWYSFINKEKECEIIFNRNDCLKAYDFVNVEQNEFCCGMINKIPVVVNTDTGLTREGITLTETMLKTLPANVQESYQKMKPGKLSMYTEINIGGKVPLGIALAAWEGITQFLKVVNCQYQYVDKKFNDTRYMIIPFKDKNLAIPSTIQNQLLFNGFHRIATKSYNVADFEVPIMQPNSIYVDIFNQNFFRQYSQLTTFIAYYNFFMDAITQDVCEHYKLPTTLPGLLIYASNLLADNNYTSENRSSLYRIRSSEIIPAMIHYQLALEISRYNNHLGSRSRMNKLQFNSNAIINALMKTETVNPLSALNPMVELNARETISKKGFRGMNENKSYSLNRRNYDESMVGKMALSSPNNSNVGINRQLVVDPKIESVRGYTSNQDLDDYNDLQLASFSELLTPGSVSRDDAIRTAIATSQTSHIVSTKDGQPVLISNGVDEIIPAYLTDEFSVMAKDDGTVIEIADGYMIVEYKNKQKQAINVNDRYSFNTGSGFYVDNKLIPNFQVGEKFKKNDILAYHSEFFNKDSTGIIRANIGPIAKVAFMGTYATYEDAGAITAKMSKRLSSKISMKEQFKLHATDDIERIVKVGDEVEIGDPLIVHGLGNTGDEAVDDFLRAFQDENSSDDSFKRIDRAKNAGRVVDVRMYTIKSMDKLSPSLFKILSEHFKENKKKRKILDKHDNTNSVYKLDTLFNLPTEPLKGSSIKGINCDVLIEIYIEHELEMSVGDKCIAYGACKQVISEVIPEGLEPYSEHDVDEEISIFQNPGAILKRMVPSLVITAAGNKVLINLKRQVKKIWET